MARTFVMFGTPTEIDEHHCLYTSSYRIAANETNHVVTTGSREEVMAHTFAINCTPTEMMRDITLNIHVILQDRCERVTSHSDSEK